MKTFTWQVPHAAKPAKKGTAYKPMLKDPA